MNELQHYADRLDALVRQLEPAQIRKLTRELARTIRRSVKQRIAANQAPDGSAYTPRSGLQGRPLRKGEILRQDQPFIVGGELKKFRRIKTERSDPKGYDPKLEMGWEYGASEVRRYHRSSITIPRAGSSLMFRKLHRYRFLKARHTDRAALVGFMGGLIADIAAQHQQGSPRRPRHLKNGLPARTLLGFSPRDLRTIEELLVSHLAGTDK